MRLTSFALRGLLAYQHGEVRVNADELPSGLIALTGPNGHGKTTLLETPLAAAFRSFPSRPDRAVMDYAGTSDAYLETTFDLDGQGAFRLRCNVDGPRRKTSAVLESVDADGTVTPLNDGKVSTYDAAIATLLPPQALLLASVFGAQTQRGSFVSLDTGARKQLFAQLLGLQHLEDMAARAKQAEKLAGHAVVPLRAAFEVLNRDARLELAIELEQLADTLQVEQGRLELQRRALQDELATAEGELAALQAAAAAYATARTTADHHEVERAAVQREHATVLGALDQLTVTTAADRSSIQAATAAALAAFDARIADTKAHAAEVAQVATERAAAVELLQRKRAKNQELLANAARVAEAVETSATATASIASLRAEAQSREYALAGVQLRMHEVSNALRDVGEADRALARDTMAAALLACAPFGDACAPCGFMAQAVGARARIPDLQHTVATRGTVEAERADVEHAIHAQQDQIHTIREQLATHEAVIAAQSPWTTLADALRQATERIADYEAQIQTREADAARALQAAEVREAKRVEDLQADRAARAAQQVQQDAELHARVTTQRTALAERGDRLAQRLTAIAFVLADLEDVLASTHEAAAQAAAQTTRLQERRRAWDASTAALASVTSRHEELARRRAQYAVRCEERDTTAARIATLEHHRQDWDVLARACARDGLQTIEIDDAGPTVSAYTNRILRDCYGPRFTVEIVTQEAKASKSKDGSTMKETFELKVYDADRGGSPRDIADLSGGEKVIVEEALKSAIALLVNDRNVHRIRTCWRDETTGPLDEDNRARYMRMLRSVHTLGGFHQTYFVTHDDEAALQSDAQLYVHDGQVDVVLPPYGRSAVAA
ncbi:MAG TPA: hypothetical protein VNJ04_08155 [Gemmatimonadaceae bacterium]|nr:hypothetical protein [Gemmatimonadaceae bacterium]